MRRALPLVFALLATLALPAAAQQRVGVSSAVNPAVSGTLPGREMKRLVIGEDVVFNERISTGPDGQTQILFVDESALSIGANSDMTIDEFVFDPKTGTGTQALSATRGIFRYVGGKLSKQATPVTLRTPSATIGIRGGVFLLDIGANGQIEVIFLYGKGLTVTGLGGVTETIRRPGYMIVVSGKGAAPSSPTPADPGLLARFLAGLDGHPGAHGGSPNVPTDSTVADSGISSTVSDNVSGNVRNAQHEIGQTQPQNTTLPPLNVNTSTSQGPLQTGINNNTPNNNPGNNQNNNPGDNQNNNPGGPKLPDATGLSGGFNSTTSPALGFTGPVAGFKDAVIKNGVLIAAVGNNAAPLSLPLSPGNGTITAGDPTATPVGPVTGTSFATQDGTFFYASLTPVNAPGQAAFAYGGTPVNPAAYAPTTPQVLTFTLAPDAALNSAIPFLRPGTGGSISNPTVSPLFIASVPSTPFTSDGLHGQTAFPKVLQASLAINGQGAGQSSALVVATGNAFGTAGADPNLPPQPVLNGGIEGSVRLNGNNPSTLINSGFLTAIDPTNNSFYGGNRISGFVLTANDCCNEDGTQVPSQATETNTATGAQLSYGFNQPAVASTPPAAANGPQTARRLIGFIGGTIQPVVDGVPGTPYAITGLTRIRTDPTTLQISADMVGTDLLTLAASKTVLLRLSFGSLAPGNPRGRQAYINDNLFGIEESLDRPSRRNGVTGDARLYLVNANVVPHAADALLPPGTSFCACQYLQWGYWGGELDTSPRSGGDRADIAHINPWIAGTPTSRADIGNLISMQATAQYSGAALGSVFNSGANYLAGGTFSETYHFGTQRGMLNITNFDGKNFGGPIFGRNGPAYAGALHGSELGGVAAGAFYGPMAAETGGTFAVRNADASYIASGIFAGAKHP